MAEVTFIGVLLDETAQRDAIHVAVAPVMAGERLRPGQHIRLKDKADTETVIGCFHGDEDALGIVDPFLPHQAEPGERFWLFLYQHSITSLRHNWTHPAFGEQVVHANTSPSKEASEAWLRAFIATADCPDYDTVIAAAVGDHHENDDGDGYNLSRLDDWGGDDVYLYFGGQDAHGSIPDEFWTHVEIVTGRKVPKRAKYFSCSC